MIHVVCSRWGTKYGAEYVNRLYEMVNKYLRAQFTFYCQTEDTQNILPNIECIPFSRALPESHPHDMLQSSDYLNAKPRLWDRPKLNYFNPDFITSTELKIALDLDLIIHNDMSSIIDLYNDKPVTGRSWWHNADWESKPEWRQRYGARNNGGFYMWQGNDTKPIWDDLLEHWKQIYFCFHGGSDNFISTRHLHLFDFLPPSLYYSFNRGCIWPHDLIRHVIRSDRTICVFNTDPGNKTNLELHEAAQIYVDVSKLWTLEQ